MWQSGCSVSLACHVVSAAGLMSHQPAVCVYSEVTSSSLACGCETFCHMAAHQCHSCHHGWPHTMRWQASLGSEGSCAQQHSRSGAHPTAAHTNAQLLSGNTLVYKSSLRAYQITTAQMVLVGSWWTAGTQRVIQHVSTSTLQQCTHAVLMQQVSNMHLCNNFMLR